MGIWIAIPVLYGIIWRKESRGVRKLTGVLCCLVAGICLGLQEASDPLPPADAEQAAQPTASPVWIKLLLFAGSIGIWSIGDVISAYLLKREAGGPPPLALETIVAFTMAGFMAAAWVASSLSYFLRTTSLLSRTVPALLPDDATYSGVARGHSVLLLGQALGMCSWLGVLKLGSFAEGSTFLPLMSLDNFVTAGLGIIFMGERLATTGWIGLVLAAIGVVLVASQPG
jgi:drug/metabolite transporter (DMT)-like permease